VEILNQFTPVTIQMVATTFIIAHTLFPESDHAAGVLEQIFCFAIREALLDEFEGVKRPPKEQLEDVLGRSANVPESVKRSFRQLTDASFGEWYASIRKMLDEKGADPSEFADALRVAKQITSAVARSRA
jgi:hypothetical protein